jgi:hypothetical protein
MTAADIRAKLAGAPEALPFLRRIVRHAVSGGALPPRIVLGEDPQDPALSALLNRILSGRCASGNGKLVLNLPDTMRTASYWRPLVEAVGAGTHKPDIAGQAAALAADTVKRLRLLFPDERPLIDALEADGAIRGFTGADRGKAAAYLKVFSAYRALRGGDAGITLSQLGSDVFNDSKALRGGPLLAQLDKILRLAFDQPDLPAAELRAACGIIDNPYTSHAVVFAPFVFATHDGLVYDFPRRLFDAEQAAVLPWETVRRIRRIDAAPGLKLVTSENAAPFHTLVARGIPALYTEGYPNTAVRALLRRFAEAGARAEHFGDTDLDGYRIAEQVSRVIPLDGLFRHDRLAALPCKPLDAAQRDRLGTFIDRHPGFRFLDALRHTLSRGWAEQEASAWWNAPPDSTAAGKV